MFELPYTETYAIRRERIPPIRSREVSIATKFRVLRNSPGTLLWDSTVVNYVSLSTCFSFLNHFHFSQSKAIAGQNIWLPASGANVERNFSLLNLVSNPKRNQSTQTNLRDHLFAYCNSKHVFFFHCKQKKAAKI